MNKTKACTKCKVEYPITSEYWHRNKSNRYGFETQCKKCKNKYRKQYYQENKENAREYNEQYYQENKEQIKERSEQYNKQWRRANKQHKSEYNKQYYQENKEEIREYNKQWGKENRDKSNLNTQRYRTRKRKLPHTLTVQEWKETKQIFDNSCAYCGITKEEHQIEYEQRLHQDHFIPLNKGGGYTKENIIPACRSCNTSKNNTDFEEWYPQYEYYSKEREQKILDYMGGLNEI